RRMRATSGFACRFRATTPGACCTSRGTGTARERTIQSLVQVLRQAISEHCRAAFAVVQNIRKKGFDSHFRLGSISCKDTSHEEVVIAAGCGKEPDTQGAYAGAGRA